MTICSRLADSQLQSVDVVAPRASENAPHVGEIPILLLVQAAAVACKHDYGCVWTAVAGVQAAVGATTVTGDGGAG